MENWAEYDDGSDLDEDELVEVEIGRIRIEVLGLKYKLGILLKTN